MRWSPQQDAALQAVNNWLNDPDGAQVFRLFGYAGTGKTTMAVHLAEGVSGDVMFGAYTGKAAHVLRTKGCVGASTIHSMIYHGREKSQARLRELEHQLAELMNELRVVDGLAASDIAEHRRVKDIREMIAQEKRSMARPAFSLNHDSAVRDAALVIIDECSMVNEEMAQDLLYFNTPVLVLGDPAQLPPVAGGGYFTEAEPDVMLTEIHRQAEDNPIIWMATQVRQGRTLDHGTYGESEVFHKAQVTPEDALAADQILVGRNKTRTASNDRYRQLRKIDTALVTPGERLVCLRNNHDKGLLNGAIWTVDEVLGIDDDRCQLRISQEDGTEAEVEAHTAHFLGKGQDIPWWERKNAEEFDYGYALTVHKSQGSQWDDILLFDESHAFRQDAARWLYTGITRAAERVRIAA